MRLRESSLHTLGGLAVLAYATLIYSFYFYYYYYYPPFIITKTQTFKDTVKQDYYY